MFHDFFGIAARSGGENPADPLPKGDKDVRPMLLASVMASSQRSAFISACRWRMSARPPASGLDARISLPYFVKNAIAPGQFSSIT